MDMLHEEKSTTSSLSTWPAEPVEKVISKPAGRQRIVQFDTSYYDCESFIVSETVPTKISTRKKEQVVESINWLGRHVPHCVIRDLTKDVLRIHKKKEPLLTIPHSQTYSAALLFVDMSGFTKLSQLLDLESLSRVSSNLFH